MNFTKAIDPKFHIEAWDTDSDIAIAIVKTSNDEAIPDDEPLMLFRARDRNALSALRYYREICERDGCNGFQMEGVENRIGAFEQFAVDHPERMKQPGITKGLPTSGPLAPTFRHGPNSNTEKR